jgi:hypothetical protein
MSKGLDSFIAEVEAASKEVGGSRSNNADYVAIGEKLWSAIEQKNLTPKDLEAQIVKRAHLIVSAVQGFSDYQDCFWETSHFLQLGIERLSPSGAVSCGKACSIMFGTEYTEDHFRPEWAIAAIARCTALLAVPSLEAVQEPATLPNLQSAEKLLDIVAKAGEKYRELIPQNPELLQAATASLALLEDLNSQSVFARQTEAKLKPLLKVLRTAVALCDTSSDAVISNLEKAVDLDNPDANLLLEAYNAMCEERPEDLALQLQAVQGPLFQLAFKGITTLNEGSKGKKNKEFFMESLMFCMQMLQPWARSDVAHMEGKRQIAQILRDAGIVTALLKQLEFWQNEWQGNFGDCGRPVFMSILELVRYFPDAVTEEIRASAPAVAIIQKTATIDMNCGGYEAEDTAARRLVAKLEGKENWEECGAAPGGGGFGFGLGPGGPPLV